MALDSEIAEKVRLSGGVPGIQLGDKSARYRRSHLTKDGHAKIAYHSAATAREAIIRLREDIGHDRLEAYTCRWCGALHLGRKKPPRRRFQDVFDELVILELGPRASGILVGENTGHPNRRLAHIMIHLKAAWWKAIKASVR